MTPNERAFLTMIAVSEGTENIGDHGYNCIVGSTPSHPVLFDSYSDHPRKYVHISNGLQSSAAGRYQILARYYDAYKRQLNLPDFSPASQDSIALQMIKECDAVNDINLGKILTALVKCRSRWASFPAAGYGQHEQDMATLVNAFTDAGGSLA